MRSLTIYIYIYIYIYNFYYYCTIPCIVFVEVYLFVWIIFHDLGLEFYRFIMFHLLSKQGGP